MQRMKKHLNNKASGDDEELYIVTASALNVREGPGSDYGVESVVYENTQVTVAEYHGDWRRVTANGWVHGAYLRRI